MLDFGYMNVYVNDVVWSVWMFIIIFKIFRCSLVEIMVEMDWILRLKGIVIIWDIFVMFVWVFKVVNGI